MLFPTPRLQECVCSPRFKMLILTSLVTTMLIASTSADSPNIVVILADDLGYGDVQPLNSKSKIATPNFNRLAKQGMTFTDAHSPSAVCTPTRYGLLCGRYPWRSRMKRGVLGGYSKPLIKKNRQTIATVLKSAGYQTACVGKWHLGLGWAWRDQPPKDINNMGIAGGKPNLVDFSKPITHGPNDLGFDHSLLVPGSLDMSPYVFVRNDRVTQIPEQQIAKNPFPAFYRKGEIAPDFKMDETLDLLTEVACRFISDAKADRPFFLYFPLTAPHKPVLPHSRFEGSTKLGPYGDFVTQVDWTVGQVLRALDKKGATENTLLIVTSDNGSFMYRNQDATKDHVENAKIQGFHPDNHTANGPWRGTKADVWEAGHRVPFFAHWPNRIKAGLVSKSAVCHTDILATAAEVTRTEFDEQSAEDSFSFANAFAGQSYERPPIIHQSGSGMLAIRSGEWKLVLGNGSGGREKPKGKSFEKPFQLFRLATDPGEQSNLIESETAKAEELFDQFSEISHGDHEKRE